MDKVAADLCLAILHQLKYQSELRTTSQSTEAKQVLNIMALSMM